MGNSSQISNKEAESLVNSLLIPTESIRMGFKFIRDYFVITDKRVIHVDVQGLTGSKKEYHSIPISSIVRFSVESAGTFDMDVEFKMWVRSTPNPFVYKISKNKQVVYNLQAEISQLVLN